MATGPVTLDSIKAQIAELQKQLAENQHILSDAEAAKEKEFKEYKELERSRSKKWMAKVIPGLSSSLDKSKLKEASEWQEAQAAENKQRDLVNRLDDNIRALNKMAVELADGSANIDDITDRFNRLDLSSTGTRQSQRASERTSLQSRPSLRASDPNKIEPFTLPSFGDHRPHNIRRNGVGGSLRVVPDQGTVPLPHRSQSQRSPSSPTFDSGRKPFTPPPMYDMNGRVIRPEDSLPPITEARDPAPPPPPKPTECESPPVISPGLPPPPQIPQGPPPSHASYPIGASQPPYLSQHTSSPPYARTPSPPQLSQPPYLSSYSPVPPPETSSYNGLAEASSAPGTSSRDPSRSPSSRNRQSLPAAPSQSSYPGGPPPTSTSPPPPHAPTPYGGGVSSYGPPAPTDPYGAGGFKMPEPSYSFYSGPVMGYYGSPQGPPPSIPTPQFPTPFSPPSEPGFQTPTGFPQYRP